MSQDGNHLKEENKILRQKLVGTRVRFTDNKRRRLAIKAKPVGRKALMEMSCILTPDMLLRWYRQLVARKYTSTKQTPGRPIIRAVVRNLSIQMAQENPNWDTCKTKA